MCFADACFSLMGQGDRGACCVSHSSRIQKKHMMTCSFEKVAKKNL